LGCDNRTNTKAKDEESEDIWCESPEFKTHSESDILELWGNWPMKKKDIACGCKERNLWIYSVKVLGLVKGPDKTIVAVLNCGGFVTMKWFKSIRLWLITRLLSLRLLLRLILLSQLRTLSLPMTFLFTETVLVEGNPCVMFILIIREWFKRY
jgi:hypothetical protein